MKIKHLCYLPPFVTTKAGTRLFSRGFSGILPLASPAALLITFAMTTAIHGQTLTYDANGTGALQTDGSGLGWTLAAAGTNAWWTGSANTSWSNSPTVYDAVFGSGGTGGAVTVGGTTNAPIVNDITFGVSGYSLTGGTINLAGPTTSVITTNADATINSVLAGTSGFIKSGSGILTLGGTNTYTGPTVAAAGTILVKGAIPGDAAVGTPDIVIGNSATSATVTLGAADKIADTAEISIGGTGTQTFNLGGNDEDIGSLASTNTSAVVSLGAATLTVKNGSTGSTDSNYAGIITGTGGLTLNGGASNTFTLSGTSANTYSGTTFVSNGILVLDKDNGVTAIAGPVTIGSSTGTDILRLASNDQIADTSAITLATANSTFDLNGNYETVGSVASSNASSSITLGSGTLTVQNTAATTFAGVISGTGGLVKNGSANFTVSGTNTYGGPTTVNNGSLIAGSTSAFGNNSAVTVVSPGTLNLVSFNNSIASLTGNGTVTGTTATLTTGSDNSSTTFSGNITGGMGLTKTGTGNFTVSGNNTYTGATTVSGGTLTAGSTTAFGVGSATSVASVTTLDLNDFSNSIGSLAGGGSVTLGTGTLTTGSNNSSTSFSGVISETGNLVKTGTGTQTLTGNNTFTGTTTINAGGITLNAASGNALLGDGVTGTPDVIIGTGATAATLTLGSSNQLADTVEVAMNGTGTGASAPVFNLANNSDTIASLCSSNSAASVTLGTGTLTTGGNNASTTFAGVVSGTTGGLTKQGTGNFTLSGANTYGGPTTISNGTLTLGADNALSNSTAVTVTSPGTFDVNGKTDIIGSIAGSGNVTLGAGNLTAGNNDTSTTYSGVMSGTGSFTKEGAGNLTLTGTNTYSGTTTIRDAGTLTLGANEVLNNNTDVIIGTGATLDLSNKTETIASLASTGTGGFVKLGTSGNLIVGGDNTSTTYAGIISSTIPGTGTLTKIGTGDLTLSGTNVFSNLVVGTPNGTSGGNVIGGDSLNYSKDTAIKVYAGNVQNYAATDVGSITLGGGASGTAATFTVNNTGSDYVSVYGNITYDATNNPNGATIIGNPSNPHLDLKSANTTITVGDSAATDSSAGTYDLTLGAYVGPLVADPTRTITKLGPGSLYVYVNGGFGHGLVNYTGTFAVGSAGGVDAGSVVFGADDSLGTTSMKGLNLFGGLVDMKAFDQTVGALNLGGGASGSTAAITMQSGGVLTLAGNVAYSATNNPNGATITGGSLVIGASRTFDIGDSTAATKDLTVSSVISGGDLTKTGAGTMTMTGLNTYTGKTNVTAGLLQVGDGGVGKSGTGATTISSGATLLGTGTVQGSTITLNSGAKLEVGDNTSVGTTGTLNLGANTSTVSTFDLKAGSQTRLDITSPNKTDPTFGGFLPGTAGYNNWVNTTSLGLGVLDTLNFQGAATSPLNFSTNLTVSNAGYTAHLGDVFDLVNWNSGVVPNFTGFTSGGIRTGAGDDGTQFNLPTLPAGLYWDPSNFATSGRLVVIPEPNGAFLLGLGATIVLVLRRRVA